MGCWGNSCLQKTWHFIIWVGTKSVSVRGEEALRHTLLLQRDKKEERKKKKKKTLQDLETFPVPLTLTQQPPMVKHCKAETWGMESNRDRVIQWKWMALTPLPITEGGEVERKKKKRKEKKKERRERSSERTERVGEMTGRLCGKREREREREREGRGLESMNLCMIKLQEALRREKSARRTRYASLLFACWGRVALMAFHGGTFSTGSHFF